MLKSKSLPIGVEANDGSIGLGVFALVLGVKNGVDFVPKALSNEVAPRVSCDVIHLAANLPVVVVPVATPAFSVVFIPPLVTLSAPVPGN